MTTETSTPAAESGALRGALAYLPGIVLLIAVGLLGKYTQAWVNDLAHDRCSPCGCCTGAWSTDG
ncbi:hypothetical protein [Nocardia wallacei]|uniref:hypothetical protein n=1 Tax=Nocardia wallacei TaxID=480035 RepID=UPI002456B7C1|nr:hypothetical protein [Nocardia wallacei]